MSLPILNFSTPEEFVDFYYEKLKEDLQVYNIQISKVGFIGFLLNLLGYTYFDLKNYYDSLFKEAFVATAQTEEALYMHAAVYGYLPAFANPSTAVGSIEFDFNNYIAKKVPGVVKREVYIGYDSNKKFSPCTFKINDFDFTINAIYKFVQDNNTYYAEIIGSDGSKVIIPSNNAEISAPLHSTKQYFTKETYFPIGKYNLGSYKTHYIQIPPGYFLSDLEVYISLPGESSETKFDISYTKFLFKGSDNVVFLRKLSSTIYVLEFGSGIRGKWVSEGTCHLITRFSKGDLANIVNSNVGLKIPIAGPVLAYDYIFTGGQYVPVSSTPAILQVPLVSVQYSEGGRDPLLGDELRTAIINYIQTRDNLVSRRDFYNVASKYAFLSDFKFMYKKINIYDFTFYFCKVFRNRMQEICYTTNHTHLLQPLINPPTNVTANLQSGGNLDPNTQYGYRVVAFDSWSRTGPSVQVTATTTNTNKSIQVSWNPVSNAVGYRVYGRTPGNQDRYWVVFNTSFIDTGDDSESVLDLVPSGSGIEPIVWYPIFLISGSEFISPFVYKYNSRMNYYEGYIVRERLTVSFTSVVVDPLTIGSGFEVPVLYLNLVYDFNKRRTNIVVKSHQDISSLSFKVSVFKERSEQIVFDENMIWNVNENGFVYSYVNSETFGLFDTSTRIVVSCYDGSNKKFVCEADNVYQMVDISDILKLFKYSHTTNTYIINIPVIIKSEFDDDKQYFLDKMVDFFSGARFSENRMIADNVQGRFLNTFVVEPPFVQSIFVQGQLWNPPVTTIKFPLKIEVEVTVDMSYVKTNYIDLVVEKDNILLELASYLQQEKSGTDIKYYNSQIIDLIHTNRKWVKSVKVKVTDSFGTELKDGIEHKSEEDILATLTDKLNAVRYTPVYVYWDLNNIEVKIIT